MLNIFKYCKSLANIYCYALYLPTTGIDVFANCNIPSATLHVPASSLEEYKNTVPWSGFGKIIALSDNDPKPTNVSHLIADDENNPLNYYTIDGRQSCKPQRGLNLIRMSDGTTKKVIRK